MSLIKSISGIRGTIGGSIGDNLTPIDIVECTAGYGKYILSKSDKPKVVLGRDGRISGEMVKSLVINTLIGMGIDVIDLDYSTTPTVEFAVPLEQATGGIIITASHNPRHWNALKFLNSKGEFISAEIGQEIIQSIEDKDITFAEVDQLGTVVEKDYMEQHIEAIINHPWVSVDEIKNQNFSVVVDCINSTGAIAIPILLDRLNVEYKLINSDVTGEFAHNPEPLQKNLSELSSAVLEKKAHMGIAVDPDVDRLAFMMENGEMFGEEYTLVAVADYVLNFAKGSTVSNLSSSIALRDVTQSHGQEYHAAAVGEVNVVNKMKEVNAIIGGEGNGGIIVPNFHYGRDALIGIALFLSYVASKNKTLSSIRKELPHYEMTKDKINLVEGLDVDNLLKTMAVKYKDEEISTIDGVKIIFNKEWVHLRKSNTEPIIRVYAESTSKEKAYQLVEKIKKEIKEII